MKTLVIYDSLYGNTEQIAQTIAAGAAPPHGAELLQVSAVKPEQLSELELLIVGSPTQRFNATPAINSLLNGLPAAALHGVRVAAFDTRFPQSEIDKTPALTFFVKLWGRSAYAAARIAKMLKKKGGQQLIPPEGFYVGGMEGPLLEGELERAADWASQIAAAVGAELD